MAQIKIESQVFLRDDLHNILRSLAQTRPVASMALVSALRWLRWLLQPVWPRRLTSRAGRHRPGGRTLGLFRGLDFEGVDDDG